MNRIELLWVGVSTEGQGAVWIPSECCNQKAFDLKTKVSEAIHKGD